MTVSYDGDRDHAVSSKANNITNLTFVVPQMRYYG